ncbi:MAG: hypothetical protein N0E44_18785, partial [Candidatus Thiodiazotropha lotti]|nr:hypothetical protein [Candidatus Thiodiazotropha lotti]MCW4221931.1 hypothetical protein [Candidatus Thiodiazotropha lotti]
MTNQKKDESVIAYKGFDKNMKCRGFQYEIGETYTHDGDVEACSAGFHSCEYPLDVFSYYPPAGSVFALVEADGEQDRHGGDSKVASEKITIKAALDLPGLIKAAIEYTTERIKPSDEPAASNSGHRGAA